MTETRDDAPLTTSKDADVKAGASEALGLADHDSAVGRSVTINRPADELFAFWRDFTNLPRFMENLVSVDVVDGDRSHWIVKAPAGKTVEWQSRITELVEGKTIAWESLEGADPNSGRVDFRAAGERGTIVTLVISYDPPAGIVGKVIAKLFQREPAIQARRELRRFKQLMETGEVATAARTHRQREEEMA